MRADNPPTRRPTKLRHRFYHAGGNQTWVADSLKGLRAARHDGYPWIDTNHLTTLDGISVCTHWGQPLKHGWYDPEGKIRRNARVCELTFAEVHRLRLRNGSSYIIRRSSAIIREAGQLGVGVEFEAKNGHWSQTQAAHLLAVAEKNNTRVVMKTISNLGGTRAAHRRLVTFHRAGWTTVVLPRGTRRIPRAWWVIVDHVRGPVWWTGITVKENR